jgi:hypothetical protein
MAIPPKNCPRTISRIDRLADVVRGDRAEQRHLSRSFIHRQFTAWQP